jgi:hypothetical protein
MQLLKSRMVFVQNNSYLHKIPKEKERKCRELDPLCSENKSFDL